MPKWKSQERKGQIQIALLASVPLWTTKVRRLNEEIHIQSSCQTFLIVNTKFTMFWIGFIERPCIKTGVDQGYGARKIDHGAWPEWRNRLCSAYWAAHDNSS
jgi:hypothetical protein